MPKGIYTKTKEHKDKISVSLKGKKKKPFTELHRKKMGDVQRGKPKYNLRGDKNGQWKGGVTPINKLIRHSVEYRLWREAVFKRDNYTCVWCGYKGELNADHIKPFAYYPELRFAIDNGRTLCVSCHKTTDTFKLKQKIPA